MALQLTISSMTALPVSSKWMASVSEWMKSSVSVGAEIMHSLDADWLQHNNNNNIAIIIIYVSKLPHHFYSSLKISYFTFSFRNDMHYWWSSVWHVWQFCWIYIYVKAVDVPWHIIVMINHDMHGQSHDHVEGLVAVNNSLASITIAILKTRQVISWHVVALIYPQCSWSLLHGTAI